MVLERLYVIPHGDEILDNPNKESKELRDKITEVTSGDNAESLLVLTPHGVSLSRGIAIINTENLYGEYQIKTALLKSLLLSCHAVPCSPYWDCPGFHHHVG